MTRSEYEVRLKRARDFQTLMRAPEWCVVDELLVKLSTETSSFPALDIPRTELAHVYDMLTGRQECIALIQNAFREFIEDLALTPDQINEETEPISLKDVVE